MARTKQTKAPAKESAPLTTTPARKGRSVSKPAAQPAKQAAPKRATRSRKEPEPAPAKAPARKSKSVPAVVESSSSEDEDQNEIQYAKNTFVAYIGNDDVKSGLQVFSLGKVLEDSKSSGTDRQGDVRLIAYHPDKRSKLNYSTEWETIVVKEYQVLCSATTTKAAANKASLAKKTQADADKIMATVWDSVCEKINDESDREADKQSNSEHDESEDEPVPITQRKLVKGKRTVPKAAVKRATAARAKSAAKMQDSSDSSEEEQKDEDVIDTKTTKIGKRRAASLNQAKGNKIQKTGNAEAKPVPQEKPKKPVPFKVGKWNPDTVIVDPKQEVERNGQSDNMIHKCCVRCNCRNLVRAVETNNIKLLKNCLNAKDQIPSCTMAWSEDAPLLTPLGMIFKKQSVEMLEAFFKVVPVKASADEDKFNEAAEAFFQTDRVDTKEPLLTRVDTGKVSFRAYGHAVRAVAMTRGNRQGNQAFTMKNCEANNPVDYLRLNDTYNRYMTPEMKQHIQVVTRADLTNLKYQEMLQYALSGNVAMLKWMIESHIKLENFGLNKLHLDALTLPKLTEKYHTASILKKAAQTWITPLHLACLNPNKEVLAGLLAQNNDINAADQQMNKLIHYAAVCSSPGPLQVLLEKGASVFDVNNQKKTPLHLAAMNSRAENVRVILQAHVIAYKYRDRANKNAFTYALQEGDLATISAFLDHSQGKIKINTGQGPERMTPLMYAAAQGQYELAEALLERKARTLSKDKYKRTPLFLAVRNGHTRLASLLLQQGSDWKHVDSSNNTALHYAAGAGFIECINLLMQHQADVNAMNSWKVTPITIAMLNNHLGTVKRLLEEPGVDVNGKDDKGRTLLSMAMLNLEEAGCVEFSKFLLDKGADINLGDINGVTPLHILAAYKYEPRWHDSRSPKHHQVAKTKLSKTLNQMIELLLKRGGNLSLKTEDGKTAFEVALDCNNIDVLEQFSPSVKLNEAPLILHKFADKIFDSRFRAILVSLLEQEKQLTAETMNFPNKEGFSPFLQYVKIFVEKMGNNTFARQIRECLLWNSFKYGLAYAKYNVCDQTLFEALPEEDDYKSAVQKIQEEKIIELGQKYLEELFTLPFIQLCKILIEKGADPMLKVQKLQFYREFDEHKRLSLSMAENRQVAQLMQIDTSAPQHADVVKTRKEAVMEQAIEAKSKKHKKEKIDQRWKEFYAKKEHTATFMKLNGKTIEVEYNKEYGLQNAVHLLFKHPVESLYTYLVDQLHIPVDEIDFMGRNPFMVNVAEFASKKQFFPSTEQLLAKKVRVDLPDCMGKTPFLMFYEHQNKPLADRMLDLGANINQMDKGGLFALKYALIRREDQEIRKLVAAGADINKVDIKGRNLLHHAVNMSSATADATFETEQTLVDLGININLRDSKGRVPLHYAFVKLQKWKDTSQIDPIETVSSLCGQPGLDIEVADKWQKTPLHYASQRGAAICTLYILQRGANIESLDIYGNSALGISLLKKHFNYAILLIQKNANVCLPIYEEFPNRIAKKWADEAKQAKKKLKAAKRAGTDVDMAEESDSDSSDELVDTGKDLFKNQLNPNRAMGYGSEDEDEDEDEDDEESEEESEDDSDCDDRAANKHEQNVFNMQNVFGMSVFGRAAPKKSVSHQGMFGAFGQPIQQKQPEPEVEKELPPKSAFRISIQNQQQGIAYLILDNKYDYMLAMQDALDEKKFNLVLTLLSKTADNSIVQRKNTLDQNLMHILAKNSHGGAMHILERIYEQLRKRGVNCLEQDSLGCNALHYAVESVCLDLCQILIGEGIAVNQVNKEGHSPLSLLMKGQSGAKMCLFSDDPLKQTPNALYQLLAKSGADHNIVYPEDSYGSKTYKCPIMVNIVRRSGDMEIKQLRLNLQTMLDNGASLNVKDSEDRDLIMHAVMQNNLDLVKFFVNHAQGDFFNESRCNQGKTAIHYVVNSYEYGSFENTKILDVLASSSIYHNDLNVRDASGKTPLDYANQQKSGVLAKSLAAKIGDASLARPSAANSFTAESEWPVCKYDFNKDSARLMEEAETKRMQELREDKKDSHVPLDVALATEKHYKVYFEGEGDLRKPYDVYMTKVDLRNGFYGEYTFYKMQMVYDNNRDLYIVLTRYGRIGETGMNQRTPFNTVDDAKKEFATIFKQKSGNEWESHLNGTFEEQKKKYVPVAVSYLNVQYKDYLAPFDYENCPKTQMNKVLRYLIEEISNVTMFQRSLQDMRINTDQLPVSHIKKQTIEDAKAILGKLDKLIKTLTETRTNAYAKGRPNIADHFQQMYDLHIQLSDLTSQFYQLIPMKETDYWAVQPIRHEHQLKQLYQQIETLTNIEFSSRLLLGALYKQKIVNPTDYIYDSLQTKISLMQSGTPEFELIKQYMQSTSSNNLNFKKCQKFNLFKVERKGEGDRYKHLDDRRLLFHGSSMTNMMGILTQGLRIAPPEAPASGYMFGKGLYFADKFEKSQNYSHGGHQTKVMLLCEVALGKSMDLYRPYFCEKLPANFQSVKAIGRTAANFDTKTVVTPDGFQVPIGAPIENKEPTRDQFLKACSQEKIVPPARKAVWDHYYNTWSNGFNWQLQTNEYIVYSTEQVKIRYLVQWQQ